MLQIVGGFKPIPTPTLPLKGRGLGVPHFQHVINALKRCVHRLAFAGKEGAIALHQIRTLDKQRLVKKIGEINPAEALRVLREMFAK